VVEFMQIRVNATRMLQIRVNATRMLLVSVLGGCVVYDRSLRDVRHRLCHIVPIPLPYKLNSLLTLIT